MAEQKALIPNQDEQLPGLNRDRNVREEMQEFYQNVAKVPSPRQQIDTVPTHYIDSENSMISVSKYIASTTDGQQPKQQQRNSKQRKDVHKVYPPYQHVRVPSNPSKNFVTQEQIDQYQAYNLQNQMFHPQQLNVTQQHFMQQPPQQVHYIAKQQKFYQISPARGSDNMPILFDKRPYTSSQLQQMLQKRTGAPAKLQSNAIAALYLPNQIQKQKEYITQAQQTPYQPPKKRTTQNLSVPKSKQQYFTQIDQEVEQQKYQELKDENQRLQAKIRMHESEMQRKEKAIDDFLQQNQFIQNAQKGGAYPIAATAQKYQQETYLLMSLKKQVKQLKNELLKREDVPGKINFQKMKELEHQIEFLKEEQYRLHQLIEFYQRREEAGISLKDNSEITASEQAHILSNGGNQTPQEGTRSAEMLYEPDQRLIDQIQQRDVQIMQLQMQLEEKSNHKNSNKELDKVETYKSELSKQKKFIKDQKEQNQELQKQLKLTKEKEGVLEQKIKDMDHQLKSEKTREKLHRDLISQKDEKIKELEAAKEKFDKKLKIINEAKSHNKEVSQDVFYELNYVAPIVSNYHKIYDRLYFVQELKHGLQVYQPSQQVQTYLNETPVHEIAISLSNLQLPKVRLDQFNGEVGESIKYDFQNESVNGQQLELEHRQYLMAKYLSKIKGTEVFVNTQLLAQEVDNFQAELEQRKNTGKKTVSDEQMLDIAEMCFVKIAEILNKFGLTVRDVFLKYSVPEIIPETKTILELLIPSAFFEAIRVELRIQELSDLEAACMMRVLSKQELGNSIILNEFALIMENFGVPLVDPTIQIEEDEFIPEGQDRPRGFDLKNIDDEGLNFLQQVARYLLKEYLHPREFFAKFVKLNVEIQTSKRAYRVDILSQKDFYLKCKIANIRKNLVENVSLNNELCLDPDTHPTYFNMKTFIKALEDIAEIEQEKLMQEEAKQLEEQKQTTDQPTKQVEIAKEFMAEAKTEVVSFGKGRRKEKRTQSNANKVILGTIEEVYNETATSVRDDESRIGSNNLRSSKMIDLEDSGNLSNHRNSMQRVEMLTRSLSGNPDQYKNLDLGTKTGDLQCATEGRDSEEHDQEQSLKQHNQNEVQRYDDSYDENQFD